MLDLNFIRHNPDIIQKNNENRGCTVSVEKIIELDSKRRDIIQKIDSLRQKMNSVTKGGKPRDEEIVRMKALKEELKGYEQSKKACEWSLNILLTRLPNITHESVPIGKSEEENVVYKKWSPEDSETGKITAPDFVVKRHWEIGQALDLIDEERGEKVAGSRFWYLKNEFVTLEFALVQYALSFLKKEGFIPMIPPIIVREKAMYGTGFFPADENEIYKLENPEYEGVEANKLHDARGKLAEEERNRKRNGTIPNWNDPDQYLIGTAEVPLAAYHADDVLNLDKPLKYAGFSSCFRREAGTYGKDMKGILRGHQFDKIEMFVFTKKEDSWECHEYLLSLAEKFWQSLGIPYRVMLMCSGDLGAANAKKYDIEAWFPGEGKYREVVSESNDTDFQARRMNIKYVAKNRSKEYVHTLNSTLIAIGRGLIALSENYQTKDGEITVPESLQPYTFGLEKISQEK